MHAGLRERLGVDVDADILERSLVHRSWAYENGGAATNERLEFLGDAVLGLVVTDELFHRHPDVPEGQLAKLRSAVVNMRALAQVALTLDLGECVQLGRGEEATGGRRKTSILADTTEAVIGAVYLSCGPLVARDLVLRLVSPLMDASAGLGAGLDWKTSLQELGAANGLGQVEYSLTESGPDHAKSFTALATFTGASVDAEGTHGSGACDEDPGRGARATPARVVGRGAGASKKEAEQGAAADAWHALSRLLGADQGGLSRGGGPAPTRA